MHTKVRGTALRRNLTYTVHETSMTVEVIDLCLRTRYKRYGEYIEVCTTRLYRGFKRELCALRQQQPLAHQTNNSYTETFEWPTEKAHGKLRLYR